MSRCQESEAKIKLRSITGKREWTDRVSRLSNMGWAKELWLKSVPGIPARPKPAREQTSREHRAFLLAPGSRLSCKN